MLVTRTHSRIIINWLLKIARRLSPPHNHVIPLFYFPSPCTEGAWRWDDNTVRSLANWAIFKIFVRGNYWPCEFQILYVDILILCQAVRIFWSTNNWFRWSNIHGWYMITLHALCTMKSMSTIGTITFVLGILNEKINRIFILHKYNRHPK